MSTERDQESDAARQPGGPSLDADEIIGMLELSPLPSEGGMWAQTWLDDAGSGIYFLLRPGDFSAIHRLPTIELWHHYCGAAVEMVLLPDRPATGETTRPAADRPASEVRRPVLGVDLRNGERPMIPVPANTWMGARTTGAWSLLGTTMAPPFAPNGFELGDRATLIDRYPEAAEDILSLTHAHEARGDATS